LGGGVRITILAALLLAAPYYITLLLRGAPFAPRLTDTTYTPAVFLTLFSPQNIGHFARPFWVYVHLPEDFVYYFYYGRDSAMLLSFVVPFFLLGVAYLLWRVRHAPERLLLLWILAVSVGNFFMAVNAIYARYVVVFPALALVTAVGVRAIMKLLMPQRWANIAALLLTLVLCVAQGTYYYGRFLDVFPQWFRASYPSPDVDDAVFRALDFPPDTRVYFITDPAPWQIEFRMAYLSDRYTAVWLPSHVTDELLAQISRAVDNAFFIDPDDARTVAILSANFGARTLQYSPYRDVPLDDQYLLYYLPRADG
jgi:hypothetical protein